MQVKPHLLVDGYKVGHKFQYPEGTQFVYSNFTARSANHFNGTRHFDNKVVVFGLQGFIKDILIDAWNKGFFQRPKEVVVAEYKRRMDAYLGPDAVPVDHIAALHDLGYLPISIRALPEGSRVDIRVPYLTVVNTHPDFFWMTNYIETVLSDEIWKPTTVATIAYEYRRLLNEYVELTGSSPEFAAWQLHDFSMRGMSNWQDAATCGAAHLLGSQGFGTDTLPAIDYLEQLYGADVTKALIAGSVPATEHSVMCMGGMGEAELETFRRLIKKTYPSGIVSIVSDTWDFWKVITVYARTLKEEILSRVPDALGNVKVVFRPDSGDPVKIVAGLKVYNLTGDRWEDTDALDSGEYDVFKGHDGKFYKFDIRMDGSDAMDFYATKEVPEHEVKGAVECLWDIFGGTETDKGYKTLDSHVGVIYGDSITLERAEAILSRLAAKGFSAGNIVFGVGSYTYQYITRDTFGMAVKATYGVVNGEGRELFKDPATGDGVKKSARGLLRVTKEDGKYVLHDQQSLDEYANGEDLMVEVFANSELLIDQTYEQIVERLKQDA